MPAGYTDKHHSYEEALSFAKSIDPDATVTNRPSDLQDRYNWKIREWDAVINGVECHVASVEELVYNSDIFPGKFVKVFYRMDTDYDYTVVTSITSEKYPEWSADADTRSKYYQNDNTIFLKIDIPSDKPQSDDELEQLWQTILKINEEYIKLSLTRKLGFSIPCPKKSSDENAENDREFINVTDFSSDSKEEFLQKYRSYK